jgi:flavin reductase (DIM6/NTAB) family NADH-FMN oxidoreductase RutF
VQQCSFVPAMVSVAIAKDRPIAQVIRETTFFALSVLGEHDHALMKKYARGIGPGEDAFAGVKVIDAGNDVKVLADAMAYVGCRLVSACEFGGDHDLLIGEVIGGKMLREGRSFVHLRGSGFHY